MKKSEEETREILNKIENVMGPFNDKEITSTPIYNGFKTSEVLIIVIISVVVSLIMGSFVTYKLCKPVGERVDDNLQEFINNYEYIINNYNGKVDKKELLDAALEAMLSKLDKNSTYLESSNYKTFNTLLEGSYKGIGIQVYNNDQKMIISGVFKNSPADKAGLKPGDIITKVNGESVEKLTTEKLASKIKNASSNPIKITYIRDNKENTALVIAGTVNIKSVSSKIINKGNKKIGYMGLYIFASNSDKQFKKSLNKLEKENLDGLIIDLRGNSGGYLSSAENIISEFLDSGHVIYEIQKNKTTVKHYSKGSITKKYKIVILVDEGSASASEIVASALHDQYGATLVGKKTYGKGTVQELQNLSNGDKYKLTTKNWLTSKGVWIDGKGIEPDIKIELDKNYMNNPSEENDNQLQGALNEF